MDLNELKKIIDGENSKVIIMENEEPILVVMNFDEYKKMKGQNANPANGQKVLQTPAKELIEEPLKIEDLPF
jgi:PHD/YefM family antitoxin component YafN of YafNO toxin-antitoxin module